MIEGVATAAAFREQGSSGACESLDFLDNRVSHRRLRYRPESVLSWAIA